MGEFSTATGCDDETCKLRHFPSSSCEIEPIYGSCRKYDAAKKRWTPEPHRGCNHLHSDQQAGLDDDMTEGGSISVIPMAAFRGMKYEGMHRAAFSAAVREMARSRAASPFSQSSSLGSGNDSGGGAFRTGAAASAMGPSPLRATLRAPAAAADDTAPNSLGVGGSRSEAEEADAEGHWTAVGGRGRSRGGGPAGEVPFPLSPLLSSLPSWIPRSKVRGAIFRPAPPPPISSTAAAAGGGAVGALEAWAAQLAPQHESYGLLSLDLSLVQWSSDLKAHFPLYSPVKSGKVLVPFHYADCDAEVRAVELHLHYHPLLAADAHLLLIHAFLRL